MLEVAAFELGDPIVLRVLVISTNGLLHSLAGSLRKLRPSVRRLIRYPALDCDDGLGLSFNIVLQIGKQ